MTPATRLLEAARAWAHNVLHDDDRRHDTELVRAVRELMDARALYPAAHAIGERVSVVGEGYSAQTGAVTAVQFSEDQILYAIDYGTGWVPATFVHPAPEPPDRRWTAADLDNQVVIARGTVDAEGRTTSVQPAPRTLPLYRAPGVSGGPDWTVEEIVLDSQPAPSWFPMDGRRVTEGSPGSSLADVQKTTFDPAAHGNGVPGLAPVTRTNTLLIPGRVQITHHTDEHGVKTTETVDLRDPTDLHARFGEALGQEWRKLEASKDVRHEWLAAFERAVEIAGEVWAKVPEQSPGPHIAPGFTCPKCGSSLWGTYDCTEPKETWTGVCHGCRFTWNRLTQDVEVGLGPEAMNPGGNTGLGLVPQSVTVATEARAFDPFDASFTDEERRGGERALDLFAAMLEARERAPS